MKRNGFSLLELSIVLVIIGLIAGGIVAGSSMIRAAELRAILTEHGQYKTAVNTFRDKYLGLPGDLKNAIAFWGDNDTVCSDGNATNNGSPGTCNGNGNGIIAENAAAAGQEAEGYMMWLQLNLAGLVSGNYTGIAGTGTGDAIPGVNVPESKLSGACWNIEDDAAGNGIAYDIAYPGHYMEFGVDGGSGGDCSEPILTPSEAWNLDKKVDDAIPYSGNLMATHWNNACTNAANNTDFTSEYRLTDESTQCALIFLNAF